MPSVRLFALLTLAVALLLPAGSSGAAGGPHRAHAHAHGPRAHRRKARRHKAHRQARHHRARRHVLRRDAPAAPTAPLQSTAPSQPAAAVAPSPAPTAIYQPLDGRVFSAPDSVWNRPLAPDAPIASYSDTYVQSLQRQVADSGSWINTDRYSVPVDTVGPAQPAVKVVLDGSDDPVLTSAFAAVPLPPDARPAWGTDGHLVVWQPSTDSEWEFWRLHQDTSGTWHASWGGHMTDVSSNPGWMPAPYGATATSLPLPDGLMTIQEQADGVIRHALAIAVPQTIAGVFLAPAQRDDGNTASWSAIPEGMRFRLPASLDIDALHLPRETAMIAKAVQDYGMIVRDTGGAVAFYAEDPHLYTQKYGIDPYAYLFGQYADALLAPFPWQDLQVVAP